VAGRHHAYKGKGARRLSDSDYASVLRSAAANLYPSDALQAANAPSDIKMLQQALADLKPLATKNPKIVGAAFDDLDTSDAASGQLQKLQARTRSCRLWPTVIPAWASRRFWMARRAPAKRSPKSADGSMS